MTVVDHRRGHGEALLLSAREMLYEGAVFVSQGEALQDGWKRHAAAVEAGKEPQGLGNREVGPESLGLKLDADALLDAAALAQGIQAQNSDSACVRATQAFDHLERGSLAGPVRT
jgi:hypothetical protein